MQISLSLAINFQFCVAAPRAISNDQSHRRDFDHQINLRLVTDSNFFLPPINMHNI